MEVGAALWAKELQIVLNRVSLDATNFSSSTFDLHGGDRCDERTNEQTHHKIGATWCFKVEKLNLRSTIEGFRKTVLANASGVVRSLTQHKVLVSSMFSLTIHNHHCR